MPAVYQRFYLCKILPCRRLRFSRREISFSAKEVSHMGVHSLALTNTPAIEGMTAIVNSATYKEEDNKSMDIIKQIAQLLGLGEDATAEQVIEALTKALEDAKALKEAAAATTGDTVVANKAVCELLDLKAGAPASDVAAKIVALKGGNIDGVNVLEQLKAMQKQNAERDANDAVTVALKAGKITPAQKDWALSYALSDKAGFASFVEKAPQIVPQGSIVDGIEPTVSKKPDEATILVCKQLGLSAEEVEKYGKEN
ncbi:MAG: phage protease [Oscillospiraceae bacterium]